MNKLQTKTVLIKNFDTVEGIKLPYYTDYVLNVVELVSNNYAWRNSLKYDFNYQTKMLKVFSATHKIITNDIEVTYQYDNYELRKIKLKKLLDNEKSK